MDGQSNNLSHEQLDELDKTLPLDGLDESTGLTIRNLRLGRIQEYEDSALARQDPYEAVIGMGSADLQRISEFLGAAILEQIEAGTQSIEELREVSPEIRLLVKIRKSIEMDATLYFLEGEKESGVLPRRLERKEIKDRAGNHFKRSLPRR